MPVTLRVNAISHLPTSPTPIPYHIILGRTNANETHSPNSNGGAHAAAATTTTTTTTTTTGTIASTSVTVAATALLPASSPSHPSSGLHYSLRRYDGSTTPTASPVTQGTPLNAAFLDVALSDRDIYSARHNEDALVVGAPDATCVCENAAVLWGVSPVPPSRDGDGGSTALHHHTRRRLLLGSGATSSTMTTTTAATLSAQTPSTALMPLCDVFFVPWHSGGAADDVLYCGDGSSAATSTIAGLTAASSSCMLSSPEDLSHRGCTPSVVGECHRRHSPPPCCFGNVVV